MRIVLIVLFAAVVLAFILVAGFQQEQIHEFKEDLAEEQRFSSALMTQVNELVIVNELLRTRVVGLSTNLSLTEAQKRACLLKLPPGDTPSPPRKRIELEDVIFSADAVIINVDNLMPGVIAPTGSMEPLLGAENIVLEMTPKSSADIVPGDVIIFTKHNERIIHRVVRIGVDEEGWFAITKGDRNKKEDPYKIRFDQVKGVLVGIIY